MLSASTSMPCSSIARSRSDTCVTMLSSGRVGGAGAPSVIPTRAIASATAQCAWTSTVLTRRPLTTTSRRRVCARTGAAARRSQPTNARPASAPVVVPRNSLRVVMMDPPFRRGRVSCRVMGRFLWPLAVVAALAIGWAAAGVAGKTSAARETEQLKQQVSTLQARLHAREEIAAARSSDAGGRPGTPSASRASTPGERGLAAAVTEDRVLRDLRARGGGPADRAASRPGSSGSSPSIEAALDRFYRYLEATKGTEGRERWQRARELVEELRGMGDVAGVALMKVLSAGNDSDERRAAARLLGTLQVPQSLPLLKDIVEKDSDVLLRRAAAVGLRQLQTPESLPVLESILANGGDDRFVRLSAAYGLAESGRPGGVTGLAQIFQESSADGRGREMAFRALASQTSPRAAGLTSQVRATPALTTLARRAVTKLAAFSDETGQPLRFTQSGALKIARTERDAEQLALEVTRGVAAGIPIDFVSVAEARRRLPILGERGIVAITWSPTDCNVEPSELPLGYCRAAEKLGAVLLPHTPATGFEIGPRGVEGVRTPRGTIATRAVVDAAGAWARLVAAGLGAPLPVVPTRHQLLITEPIPGVGPELPIARVIDVNVYVRHERGGLMLGGYEPDPVQVDAATLPPAFDVADLPLDLEVLWRLARSVREQFPIFQEPTIRVAEHRGGLPTLTMDDRYLVGPLPGVAGAWVMSGCCVGGLSVSPALGEAIAEWIVDGAPALDCSDISPARFAGPIDEAALRERCRHAYATHYRASGGAPAR